MSSASTMPACCSRKAAPRWCSQTRGRCRDNRRMSEHSPAPRRALVIGGSGDLGGAICRQLAADGFHVIVHANGNLARAAGVVAAVVAGGGSAEAVAFDVADGDATGAAIAALLEAGPVQAVVNNAGIHDDAPMAGMSAEQ